VAIKKIWYEIIAPKIVGEITVGETPAADPKQLIGRIVNVSVADIDRKHPKFYLKLAFQIENVEGTKAFTKFVGHDILSERIYRMVQRRSSRIDSIEDLVTKDGVKLRIKPLMILPSKVATSVKHDVRRIMTETVRKIVSENTLEDIVKMILSDEIQRTIREECKKLYPVGMVEIRKSEVLV